MRWGARLPPASQRSLCHLIPDVVESRNASIFFIFRDDAALRRARMHTRHALFGNASAGPCCASVLLAVAAAHANGSDDLAADNDGQAPFRGHRLLRIAQK